MAQLFSDLKKNLKPSSLVTDKQTNMKSTHAHGPDYLGHEVPVRRGELCPQLLFSLMLLKKWDTESPQLVEPVK